MFPDCCVPVHLPRDDMSNLRAAGSIGLQWVMQHECEGVTVYVCIIPYYFGLGLNTSLPSPCCSPCCSPRCVSPPHTGSWMIRMLNIFGVEHSQLHYAKTEPRPASGSNGHHRTTNTHKHRITNACRKPMKSALKIHKHIYVCVCVCICKCNYLHVFCLGLQVND